MKNKTSFNTYGLCLIVSSLTTLTSCQKFSPVDLNAGALAQLQAIVTTQYGTHINVPPLEPEIAKLFAYQSKATLVNLEIKEQHADFTLYRGQLTATDQAHIRDYPSLLSTPDGTYTIKFDFFVSKHAKYSAPLVMQLPALNSGGNIERDVGSYLTQKGYHSLAVYPDRSPTSTDQPIDQLGSFFIQNAVAAQQALDFILAANQIQSGMYFTPIDPNRIFSFGISLGGMQNGMLLAVEPRIRKGIIIMGGGDIPAIIAGSEEPNVSAFRNHWSPLLTNSGKTPTSSRLSFEIYLRSVVKLDPLRLAPYIPSKRVSMVISENDNVVPTIYQKELFVALGAPAMATITFPYYEIKGLRLPSDVPTGHFDLVFAAKKVLDFSLQQFQASLQF